MPAAPTDCWSTSSKFCFQEWGNCVCGGANPNHTITNLRHNNSKDIKTSPSPATLLFKFAFKDGEIVSAPKQSPTIVSQNQLYVILLSNNNSMSWSHKNKLISPTSDNCVDDFLHKVVTISQHTAHCTSWYSTMMRLKKISFWWHLKDHFDQISVLPHATWAWGPFRLLFDFLHPCNF